jgi:hypothetical protein
MKNFTLNYEDFISEAYALGSGDIKLDEINFKNFEDSIFESLEVFEKTRVGLRIVDIIPTFSGLNESLNHLTEDELWKLEHEFWESVAEYVQESYVNEGFWSGVVKITKDTVQSLGNKAQQFFTKIVEGVAKFIKSAIDAAKEGLNKLIEFGKNLSKKLFDNIKSEAEERAKGLTQYPKEEVQKDVNDLKKTVDWISGKGLEGASEDSIKAGESAIKQLAQDDAETKERLIDKIEGLDELNSVKYKGLASKIINELRKKSLEPGNESIYEDLVDWSIMMNEIEEMKSSVKEAVKTKKETEEKRAESEKNIPDVENPLDDLDKTIDNKIQSHKKQTNFKRILKFSMEIVLLGAGRVAEEILKYAFKGGLKSISAVCRKLGGPGVFTFVTIAAAAAFILALLFDVLANFGDQLKIGETVTKIAHFAHDVHMYSALGQGAGVAKKALGIAAHHGGGHAAEEAVGSFPYAETIIKCISVSIAAYIGITHIMHYMHESKEEGGKGTGVLNSEKSLKIISKEKEQLENDRDNASEEMKVLMDKLTKALTVERNHHKSIENEKKRKEAIQDIIDEEESNKKLTEGEMRSLKERYADLRSQNVRGSKDKELDKLSSQIKEKESKIKEAEDKISNLEQKLEEVEEQLKEAIPMINKGGKILTQINDLRKQIKELKEKEGKKNESYVTVFYEQFLAEGLHKNY